MNIADFSTYIVPTTVSDGNGKFHPGIKYGLQIHYWANRKFDDENEAYTAAELAVNDAIAAANSVIREWNLTSLT